jgi:hypothetical protein
MRRPWPTWGLFLPNKKKTKIEINKKGNKLKTTKIKKRM